VCDLRALIQWVLVIYELDSGQAGNVEQARPDIRRAIEWLSRGWRNLTAKAIFNCWEKVKMLGTLPQ
jgi:hypothetical protein